MCPKGSPADAEQGQLWHLCLPLWRASGDPCSVLEYKVPLVREECTFLHWAAVSAHVSRTHLALVPWAVGVGDMESSEALSLEQMQHGVRLEEGVSGPQRQTELFFFFLFRFIPESPGRLNPGLKCGAWGHRKQPTAFPYLCSRLKTTLKTYTKTVYAESQYLKRKGRVMRHEVGLDHSLLNVRKVNYLSHMEITSELT